MPSVSLPLPAGQSALDGDPADPRRRLVAGPLPRRAFPRLCHIDVAGGTLDGTVLLWENVVAGGTNRVETTSVLRAHAPGNPKLSADNRFGLAGHGVGDTPDGACVVSGSQDETARVRDAATGVCVRVLDRHCEHVKSMDVGDGRIATGDCAGVVKWLSSAGSRLRALFSKGGFSKKGFRATAHVDAEEVVLGSPGGNRWDTNVPPPPASASLTNHCAQRMTERGIAAATVQAAFSGGRAVFDAARSQQANPNQAGHVVGVVLAADTACKMNNAHAHGNDKCNSNNDSDDSNLNKLVVDETAQQQKMHPNAPRAAPYLSLHQPQQHNRHQLQQQHFDHPPLSATFLSQRLSAPSQVQGGAPSNSLSLSLPMSSSSSSSSSTSSASELLLRVAEGATATANDRPAGRRLRPAHSSSAVPARAGVGPSANIPETMGEAATCLYLGTKSKVDPVLASRYQQQIDADRKEWEVKLANYPNIDRLSASATSPCLPDRPGADPSEQELLVDVYFDRDIFIQVIHKKLAAVCASGASVQTLMTLPKQVPTIENLQALLILADISLSMGGDELDGERQRREQCGRDGEDVDDAASASSTLTTSRLPPSTAVNSCTSFLTVDSARNFAPSSADSPRDAREDVVGRQTIAPAPEAVLGSQVVGSSEPHRPFPRERFSVSTAAEIQRLSIACSQCRPSVASRFHKAIADLDSTNAAALEAANRSVWLTASSTAPPSAAVDPPRTPESTHRNPKQRTPPSIDTLEAKRGRPALEGAEFRSVSASRDAPLASDDALPAPRDTGAASRDATSPALELAPTAHTATPQTPTQPAPTPLLALLDDDYDDYDDETGNLGDTLETSSHTMTQRTGPMSSQLSSQTPLTGSSSETPHTLIPPTNEELIGFMASQQRRWAQQERLNQQSRDKATYFTETLDAMRGRILDLENIITAKDERIRALEEELERVRKARRGRRIDDDDEEEEGAGDEENDGDGGMPGEEVDQPPGIKLITDPKVDTETKLKQIFRPRSSVVEARRAAPDYVPPAWSLEGAKGPALEFEERLGHKGKKGVSIHKGRRMEEDLVVQTLEKDTKGEWVIARMSEIILAVVYFAPSTDLEEEWSFERRRACADSVSQLVVKWLVDTGVQVAGKTKFRGGAGGPDVEEKHLEELKRRRDLSRMEAEAHPDDDPVGQKDAWAKFRQWNRLTKVAIKRFRKRVYSAVQDLAVKDFAAEAKRIKYYADHFRGTIGHEPTGTDAVNQDVLAACSAERPMVPLKLSEVAWIKKNAVEEACKIAPRGKAPGEDALFGELANLSVLKAEAGV
ncbi:hypothetical protein DFJ73DRAFT_784518 [Zopfochytrium polystomum]|nr:hypothetical protein DFJ73DRAFT_784518 [Zopfochytrium polystomum]